MCDPGLCVGTGFPRAGADLGVSAMQWTTPCRSAIAEMEPKMKTTPGVKVMAVAKITAMELAMMLM